MHSASCNLQKPACTLCAVGQYILCISMAVVNACARMFQDVTHTYRVIGISDLPGGVVLGGLRGV